jgi:hypothetical protein
MAMHGRSCASGSPPRDGAKPFALRPDHPAEPSVRARDSPAGDSRSVVGGENGGAVVTGATVRRPAEAGGAAGIEGYRSKEVRGHDRPIFICLSKKSGASAWTVFAVKTPNAIKTAGYLVSTLSVVLLGVVSLKAAFSSPVLMICLVGGMIASALGMLMRWISYQVEKD